MRTSPEQKKEIIEIIQSGKDKIYRNEKVWNFLIADILSNPSFLKQFFTSINDDSISIKPNYDIWLESQPISPRKYKNKNTERNTHIDIAFGCIKQRNQIGKKQLAKSGIKYELFNNDGWICFIEGKFESKLSEGTTYDPCKNQLTRVVENALCFQGEGCFPEKLYVVLLTPKIYRNDVKKNYVEKLKEYTDEPRNILTDIESSKIQRRTPVDDWRYPDNIDDRIQCLRPLKHLSYEEIIKQAYGIPKIELTNLNDEEKTYLKKILNNLAKKLEESI